MSTSIDAQGNLHDSSGQFAEKHNSAPAGGLSGSPKLAKVLAVGNKAERVRRAQIKDLVHVNGSDSVHVVIAEAVEQQSLPWTKTPRGGVKNPVQSSLNHSTVWDVPVGLHLQNLDTGELLTRPRNEVKVVGKFRDLDKQDEDVEDAPPLF